MSCAASLMRSVGAAGMEGGTCEQEHFFLIDRLAHDPEPLIRQLAAKMLAKEPVEPQPSASSVLPAAAAVAEEERRCPLPSSRRFVFFALARAATGDGSESVRVRAIESLRDLARAGGWSCFSNVILRPEEVTHLWAQILLKNNSLLYRSALAAALRSLKVLMLMPTGVPPGALPPVFFGNELHKALVALLGGGRYAERITLAPGETSDHEEGCWAFCGGAGDTLRRESRWGGEISRLAADVLMQMGSR
eukprot:g13702.t1